MTATYITAALCVWCIAAMLAIALVRGADTRRQPVQRLEREEA